VSQNAMAPRGTCRVEKPRVKAMRTIIAVIVAALVSAVVACSKTDSSKASRGGGATAQGALPQDTAVRSAEPMAAGQPPAACALVTDDDMTAALGAVFPRSVARTPNLDPAASICQYRNGRRVLTVKLEPVDPSAYEKAKDGLPGGEEIPALGDAAYFHLARNVRVAVGTLLVLKGSKMLTVAYGGFNMDKDKAESDVKALAARLAPKL
jgi:hypothetical protein